MELMLTDRSTEGSKILTVRETYEIVAKELEVEKRLWESAEITLWTCDDSGMSFEVSEVKLGSIKREDSSQSIGCLILPQHNSSTIHLLSGEIKLRSSIEKGEFLEFENKDWYYIEQE